MAHSFAIPIILFLTFWVLFYLPLAGVAGLVRGAAKRAASRIGRTRLVKSLAGRPGLRGLRPYAAPIIVVLAGALVAVVAAHLFVELAGKVKNSSSTISNLDRTVQEWFLERRQPGVILLLRIFTFLGGLSTIGPVVGGVTLLLLLRKERVTAAYLAGTAIGGYLLNIGLKLLFARTRPDLAFAVVATSSYSFPSGHAMESFIVYGALAYVALRQPWPWKLKSALLALAATLVLLIGLSRVYLGVHWLSDIGGGWTAGLVWLLTATLAFDMVPRLTSRRRARRNARPPHA